MNDPRRWYVVEWRRRESEEWRLAHPSRCYTDEGRAERRADRMRRAGVEARVVRLRRDEEG